MRKGSVKNNRLCGEVRKALSEIIFTEVKDPRISGMLSVTETYVAPDLKSCKAYISVLGSKEDLEDTIKGLKSAEGFIRRELAHKMNMRNTPEITFIPDESIAYGVEMTHKAEELVKDLPKRDEQGYVINSEKEENK